MRSCLSLPADGQTRSLSGSLSISATAATAYARLLMASKPRWSWCTWSGPNFSPIAGCLQPHSSVAFVGCRNGLPGAFQAHHDLARSRVPDHVIQSFLGDTTKVSLGRAVPKPSYHVFPVLAMAGLRGLPVSQKAVPDAYVLRAAHRPPPMISAPPARWARPMGSPRAT
jgi:hypothetical protein